MEPYGSEEEDISGCETHNTSSGKKNSQRSRQILRCNRDEGGKNGSFKTTEHVDSSRNIAPC